MGDRDEDRQRFRRQVSDLSNRLGADRDLPEAPEPLKIEWGRETQIKVEELPAPPPPPQSPPPEEKPTGKWYTKDFVYRWPPGGRYNGKFGTLVNAAAVKRSFWDAFQIEILPIVQEWLDDGWQPISEIGPSALVLEDRQQNPIAREIWPKYKRKVYLSAIKVKMRKRM
jgi:hypothetical protein